jgi:hypothetical protein
MMDDLIFNQSAILFKAVSAELAMRFSKCVLSVFEPTPFPCSSGRAIDSRS